MSAALLGSVLAGGCGAASKAPETPEEFRAAMIERSVVSTGNTSRLSRLLRRAAGGADITVAYLGGSITEGFAAGARSPKCYASLSAENFKRSYCSGGTVNCRNNGLSGTPSVLGMLRAPEETLISEPDIIFIEFAVNDGRGAEYRRSYESLVRTCLTAENEPVVILLFTYMENGHTCQDDQQEIGAHYDLGMISVRDAILPELEAGRMKWRDYAADDVHPSDAGHALIAEFIAKYFEKAAAAGSRAYALPEPLQDGLYTDPVLYDAANMRFQDGSWEIGTESQRFPAGFVYRQGTGNQPLSFDLHGKTVFLVYQLNKDSRFGTAGVWLNGELTACVNGNGANGWGGPAVVKVAESDTAADLHAEIRMLDGEEDKAFTILAVGVTQ